MATAEQEEPRTEEEEENEERWKDRDRKGRYGREFGTLVHRALEMCLRDPGVAAREAVDRAGREVGRQEHRDQALADVEGGLEALAREGLLGEAGRSLRLEYPVSGPGGSGTVLLGYVDLVRVEGDRVTVIDFKTDPPPQGAVAEVMPGYVEQVRMYSRLLREGGIGIDGEVRCGLLFTGDGGVRWL